MPEISEKRLAELLDAERRLDALRDAGVDNWSGWDFAMEIYHEYEEADEEGA